MRVRSLDWSRLAEPKHLVAALVAVALLVTALNYGGYGNQYAAEVAIVTWLVLLAGIGTSLFPRSDIDRPGLIALGLVFGMLAVSALSIIWAADVGRAFSETILMVGVAGIFLLAIVTSRRGEGRAWLLGLLAGLGAIVLLAALSRYFPWIGNDAELSENLGPIMSGRLSWPLGYWNATGMVTVMFIVLLLWMSSHEPKAKARRLFAAAIPVSLAVLYLTASRGGFTALTIGVAMLLAFGPHRRRLLTTVAVTAACGLPIILLISEMGAVAHAGTGSRATVQGLIFLAASLAFSALTWLVLPAIERKTRNFTPERKVTIGVGATIAVVGLILLIASNPIERISEFTAVPFGGVDQSKDQAFAAEHLLSANGNGRWQLWDAAIEAFGTEPLRGIGAGGYEAYFKENGDYWMKTVDPHSLFFQILAETGLIGILLFLGFIALLIRQALLRIRSAHAVNGLDETERGELVAFLTLTAVGCFSLAVDWTGQFPVIYGTLMICTAMIVGPAYATSTAGRELVTRRVKLALTVGVILLSGVALFFSTRAYQAASALETSREATRSGDGEAAIEAAERAVSATPWDGLAWQRVADALEDVGNYGAALSNATEATDRAPTDEEVWLTRARIEATLGLDSAWVESMVTAYMLDPRSAYWNDLKVATLKSRARGEPNAGLELVFYTAAERGAPQ